MAVVLEARRVWLYQHNTAGLVPGSTQNVPVPGASLSKSRIAAFEQCAKRLWLQVHRPEAAVEDESAQLRLASGTRIGEIARELAGEGMLISSEDGMQAAIRATIDALERDPLVPIYEATFEREGVLVRVDILEPDGAGGWHVAEVKSSTKPKDYHAADLATQLWVLEAQGIVISSSSVRHIDNRFTLKVEDTFDGLLTDSDIAEHVDPVRAGRGAVVEQARLALSGDEIGYPERAYIFLLCRWRRPSLARGNSIHQHGRAPSSFRRSSRREQIEIAPIPFAQSTLGSSKKLRQRLQGYTSSR